MGAPPRYFGKAVSSGGGEACLCGCCGGAVSTVVEPLRGKGGIAGCEDAGGARALLLTQLKDLCAVSAGTSSTR
jgi:hypothetical protein